MFYFMMTYLCLLLDVFLNIVSLLHTLLYFVNYIRHTLYPRLFQNYCECESSFYFGFHLEIYRPNIYYYSYACPTCKNNLVSNTYYLKSVSFTKFFFFLFFFFGLFYITLNLTYIKCFAMFCIYFNS